MPESSASDAKGLPHDGLLMLQDAPAASELAPPIPGLALGGDEVRLGLGLGLVVQLLLLGVVGALQISIGFPGIWQSAVLAALMAILLWWLLGRTPVYGRHLVLWRGGLFLLSLAQAVAWSPLLASGEPATIGMGFVGVLLGVLALWVWPLGMLVMALLGVAVLVTQPDLATLLPVALIVVLLIVALGSRLLLGRWRETELKRQALVRGMAELNAELADQQQRVKYESDQRQGVERDMQAVRELADSAGRAKTEFLATISHEIRTPLNGILPILEMLRDTRLDPEQSRYVSTAFSSSQHLLRIIDDLLDFAKAESGKLQLESIEVDLRELTDSVVELMRRSAVNKGLRLSVDIEGSIPRVLRGDPSRLRQVLTNLISNAIKFTDAGEVDVRITRRRASRKEVELLFEVTDTGVGMSRESARKLFHSFTQADASTTRKHGGTGLGLAICKRLVELMGGKIGVRSRLGEGANFWFVLPMRKSVMDVPTDRRDLQGVRLLTAIADKDAAKQVSASLKAWGVIEEAVALHEVPSRLHASALLGSSWSFELLLIDSWGAEQAAASVLREIRADPLLKKLNIVVASQSEAILERMHQEFGAYTLSGGLKSGPLRRCLHRLFDVETAGGYDMDGMSKPAFEDLNLGKELIATEALPQASVGAQPGQEQVLLVEDNPVNLAVVQRVLERLGLAAVTAHNGREALERLSQVPVRLVLMDCQMPVMDGYQATEQWRDIEAKEQREPLPIIAMTANAMQGDREKCLDAGMDDYMAKPVSLDQVRSMLRQWMPDGWQPADHVEADGKTVVANQAAGAEVLDAAVLEELTEVMGAGLPGLMRTYLQNAPDLMSEIDQAVSRGSVTGLVAPAHSLKSSSANLGAMHLSMQARQVEHLAREGRAEAVEAARDLPALFAAARDALRQRLIAYNNSEA